MRYDLAVVGAGIVGTAVAHEARRRRPAARILLLDRSRAGSGATRFSAALSLPTGSTPEHRRLAARAERRYADLDKAGAIPPRRPLTTYWIVADTDVPLFRREFVGDPPRPVGAAGLAALRAAHPDLVVRPGEVVFSSGGGWAGDAERTALMLAARHEASGGDCWEGVRVDDCRPAGSGHVLLASTGERLYARTVVLATGPWLAGDPGRDRAGWDLRVKKVAALHLARRPPSDDPAVVFWTEDAFLLPLPDGGRTLFSFRCPTWDVRPDPGTLALDRADAEGGRAVLAARSPSLASAAAGGRAFCDGYLPDRLPAVVADPGRPGVVLAGGGSGSGFRLAPALAELAVSALDDFAEG